MKGRQLEDVGKEINSAFAFPFFIVFRTYLEKFALNPQYVVTLYDPFEDDDNQCTLIVSLMQKRSRTSKNGGIRLLSIGNI